MTPKLITKVITVSGCIVSFVVLYFGLNQLTPKSPPVQDTWIKMRTLSSSSTFKTDQNINESKANLFSSVNLNQKPVDRDIVMAFADVLTKSADTRNNIAISLIDYGYLDMALNLHHFYKVLNITNYIFVSSDDKACLTLEDQAPGIACLQYMFDADAGQSSSYGSASFVRKTHRKTKIVLDALRLKFNVLLVDGDMVVFKNPFPYFESCPDCDLQVQWDHGTACSGFYFVRSTKAGIELIETSWNITLENPTGLMDQASLNSAMEAMKPKAYYKEKILPEQEFPNGFAYFHMNKIMFATDGPYPPNVYIIHDNWIVSEAAKIYRFKENLMWFDDRDRYYSDISGKYLVYRNSRIDTDEVHQLEMDALKSALLIGRALNRIVILPSFSCKGCNTGKFDACEVATGQCCLLARYKLAAFDQTFGKAYREHMFLKHPLVPTSVIRSRSQTIVIESQLNAKYGSARNTTKEQATVKFTPKKPASGATVDELRTWFTRLDDVSVLMFDTLYGAVDLKAAESADKGVTKKLSSGFQLAHYMQL